MSTTPTLDRTGRRRAGVPILVFSLVAVWAVAVAVGRWNRVAGAVIGIVGAGAVLAHQAATWVVPRLRERGMLGDPATWGIAVAALAPFLPGRLGPNLYGLSIDDLPFILATVLVAWSVVRREGPRRLLHPVAVPLYLFALWSAVALTLDGGVVGGLQGLGRWGTVAVAVAAIAVVARREGYAPLVVGAVLTFGFLQALFGLWAYQVDWTMNTAERLYHIGLERWRPWEDLRLVSPGRITGSLGVSSNFFGGLMIVPSVLAVGAFAGVRTWPTRLAYATVALVTFVALVLSFTRASILGVLAGFLLVLVATRRFRVVSLVVLLVLVAALATPILQRLDVGNNRLALTRTTIQLIQRRPLTGVGEFREGAADVLTQEDLKQATGTGGVVTPHDSFLRAAAETGVPGGILLFLGAVVPGIVVLAAAVVRRPEQAWLAGMAGAMFGYGIQTFSNNLLHIPNAAPYYWLVAAAGVGLAALARHRSREAAGG